MDILLIHTGGTIGMAPTENGLAPMTGLVETAVVTRLDPSDRLAVEVFAPLLDSADVGPAHWNLILDTLDRYPDHRVIVTHGTDTMAYTGTALAQALAGTERTVILTGSMIPLGMDGDAETNLDLALTAIKDVQGVHLAFAGALLPAACLAKTDTHKADAFASVASLALHAPKRRRFDDRALAVLTLTPGLKAKTLSAMLSDLDGAVLRLFGSGTAASDPELLGVLQEAVAKGLRLRAVSQCLTGGLAPGTYAAGAGLWSLGIENGGAETPEAALVHLWLN
ncbi:asparaginase domain-containing protein [Marivivens sp. LCG002]|uniref:asparaginase domain-containing protein n=1 Tax=Marivivens sp. LCG002 TaxID=3051171 RepID=UPI002555A9EB|nr:asparaginase domain-containing protein [Marivivens sp. LCG002]WIV51252.1 asparaginase domain-containing protein [Marivivens sp. LCG002]